ncbi:Calcineurin-like phosphoesterase superfamily protein [Ruminococcaceae bacterium YRB3002]|nr:Calcineurin-like phosphoesterase superfamily protein [Ruminococcaceae bacterium YRB3002]
MIYFTSDMHFGHNRDFIYKARGFENIAEHDQALIANWNDIVDDRDTVYVLGDIMLKDNVNGRKCWNQLKGIKKIVWGNHDSQPRRAVLSDCFNTEVLGDAATVRIKGHTYYLSHYPSLTGNYDQDKARGKIVFNLCGHTHTTDRFSDIDKGPIYHVELDCHDLKPVSIDEIIADFDRVLK